MKKWGGNTCNVGNVVLVDGRRMEVAEVIFTGREPFTRRDQVTGAKRLRPGEKSEITAYRIMEDNGQVLRRSPIYIGVKWSHLPGARRKKVTRKRNQHAQT